MTNSGPVNKRESDEGWPCSLQSTPRSISTFRRRV